GAQGKTFNPRNTRCIPPVERIFPALILGPMEAFETTSGTWFQNLPSNPTSPAKEQRDRCAGKNVQSSKYPMYSSG
ncbi:MAG: hypothetical protein PVG41_20235, partial [Desulfobacteraceae bacterium]